MSASPTARRRWGGFVAGPVSFVAALAFAPRVMAPDAAATLAVVCWVALWWTTEAAPVSATSLLPFGLLPILGVTSVDATAAAYANPVLFLFLGGFLVAIAIERWGLHRRMALVVLARFGDTPTRLVFGFMLVSAVLSMWVSNSATAMLMVPIGMAVIAGVTPPADAAETPAVFDATAVGDGGADPPGTAAATQSNFGVALMLGIAYGASIGGVATLIGTPPNAILAGLVSQSLGVELGFVRWMLFGVPFAAVFLVLTWAVLVRLYPPEAAALDAGSGSIRAASRDLGPLSTPERRTLAIFGLVVVGWLTRPLLAPFVPGLTDAGVAVLGGLLFFLVPAEGDGRGALLDWSDTRDLPWGVLLLFGAGFALAHAFQSSGLDRWVGTRLTALAGADTLVVLAATATLVVFLTEVTSNTATATLFIPLAATVALSVGTPPLVLMTVVAVAASLAFMLPVATPPNAVVFGSGAVTIPQMVRAGFVLNLLGIALLLVAATVVLPVLW